MTKTGYLAHNTLLTANVLAADCITSDAYATSFMVMGLDKTKAFLKTHPELWVYLIFTDEKGSYQVWESPQMKSITTDAKEE